MNTGIQDAAALASRLTAVLRDGAADTVLDEYETERRPVAADVVALTHRITRIATIDSVPLRKTRNALLRALDWVPAVHHSLAMRLSELTSEPHPSTKS
jgi:2-polyprenyl-6-methoxyphenol hydroxylase-like FAD-dependent oxidoreductase